MTSITDTNVIPFPARHVEQLRLTPWMIGIASDYWFRSHQRRNGKAVTEDRPGTIPMKKPTDALLAEVMVYLAEVPMRGTYEVRGIYDCTVLSYRTDRALRELRVWFSDATDAVTFRLAHSATGPYLH
jgi:hypothetical protein